MTRPCRPIPFVRFVRHPRDLAESATTVSYGTACELGSIFTPGPVPENPLKCFFVENVQENWNQFFCRVKRGHACTEPDLKLIEKAVRLYWAFYAYRLIKGRLISSTRDK
jgi:hypothetical protein